MRPVTRRADLDRGASRAAASEAQRRFGTGELYVEQLLTRARHVEVQIVGDGTGAVVHLWDRECSLQRQRQKLVEIAPAVGLPEALRAGDAAGAAVTLGAGGALPQPRHDRVPGRRAARREPPLRLHRGQRRACRSSTRSPRRSPGLDLVRAAAARSPAARTLADLGLTQAQRAGAARRGDPGAGQPGDHDRRRPARPAGGVLDRLRAAVRARACASTASATPATAPAPRYDSLLAKVIVHGRRPGRAPPPRPAAR